MSRSSVLALRMASQPVPQSPASHRTCAAGALVARLVQNADIPSLGVAVSRVAKLTESATSSLGDLANMILADVHLTQRVLRLANSAAVRRFSPPVTTVSKAIARIGSEQVKLIALSALLLERMADKELVTYLAGELLQALCASSVADHVAPKLAAEPEEAAICALFRSIGRLMVAVYETPCFEEVRHVATTRDLSESEAAKEVTGSDFETIGQRILVHWGIPDAITRTVTSYAPKGPPPETPTERLQCISAFAADVAVAMRKNQAVEREAALERTLADFAPALKLDRKELSSLIEAAGARTRQFTAALGLDQQAAAADDDGGAANEMADIALPSSAQAVAEELTPGGKPARSTMLLLAGIQDMTTGIAEGQAVGSVLNIALETLYRGLGYHRAVLCLRDSRAKVFRARMCFGDLPPERARHFSFPSAPAQDLFWSVMQRNVDVHIRDATEPKIRANLPAWFDAACPDACSFVLLPIVVKQVPLGFYYADRTTTDDEGLSEEELALVRMLKGQTVVALRGSGL